MSSGTRLGYLVPQFPGQTHIFFWREIASLRALGADVTLFSTRRPPKGLIAHEWSARAMEETIYLGDLGARDALGLLSLPFLLRRGDLAGEPLSLWRDIALAMPAARQLVRVARARGIGHVHVHSCGRAALIALMAQRMGGPGYSLTLHGPLSDYGPGQRMKWKGAVFGTVITRKLIDELRADLGDDLPARLELRPMGVDTDALKRSAPYLPVRQGEKLRLFSCGRLNVVKGHQDLMQAVRLLRDRGMDVGLDIAGEDDAGGTGYRHELAARIRELGLEGHVRLLGAIDSEAVKAKLLAAHIFVLASWHEPLGVAYMEAMSCAVPVIGTDAGGAPELITDGETGLLVAPKDPGALAGAIERLAGDPGLARALSDAGRAHAVAGYRASLGAETILEALRPGARRG